MKKFWLIIINEFKHKNHLKINLKASRNLVSIIFELIIILKISLLNAVTIKLNYLKFSSITLKINNTGNISIYNQYDYYWCNSMTKIDHIYIDGNLQREVKNNYYLEKNDNNNLITAQLIWKNEV